MSSRNRASARSRAVADQWGGPMRRRLRYAKSWRRQAHAKSNVRPRSPTSGAEQPSVDQSSHGQARR